MRATSVAVFSMAGLVGFALAQEMPKCAVGPGNEGADAT